MVDSGRCPWLLVGLAAFSFGYTVVEGTWTSSLESMPMQLAKRQYMLGRGRTLGRSQMSRGRETALRVLAAVVDVVYDAEGMGAGGQRGSRRA